MVDVDDMEKFWISEINNCLNTIAPWKIRKMKHKKFCLPKEIQMEIKKRKILQKRYKDDFLNNDL